MNQKQQVGEKAASFVEDNMVVGLGTGSTAAYMVEALAKRVQAENLTIECVATSNATFDLAQSLGLNIKQLAEVDEIDLTIDGADEVSPDFQGIKGGGAALLFKRFEKTGYHPSFRLDDAGAKLLTDSGNYVIDLALEKIEDPKALAHELKAMVGVVEHGLFIDIVDQVIVGSETGEVVVKER